MKKEINEHKNIKNILNMAAFLPKKRPKKLIIIKFNKGINTINKYIIFFFLI